MQEIEEENKRISSGNQKTVWKVFCKCGILWVTLTFLIYLILSDYNPRGYLNSSYIFDTVRPFIILVKNSSF